MTTLIVGANGNMGRRYQAILNYFEQPFIGIDKQNDALDLFKFGKACDRIIIATPTETHVDMIKRCLPLKKPIFCEKPVSKDIGLLKSLFAEIKSTGGAFAMACQYRWLVRGGHIGRSYYNYFRHGNDGLQWDCIQIIGLSRQVPRLAEDSPIWGCMINNQALKIQDMDAAYLEDIKNWLKNPYQNLNWLLEMHEKTNELAKGVINGDH